MRLFELRRVVDESGVSGTGVVAQGVIFDNGWCGLTWLTPHTSVAFYTSIAEVVAIHGHNGKTRVVQIANCDMDAKHGPRHLLMNRAQDECESIGVEFTTPNHNYVWEQRDRFAAMFQETDLGSASNG